MENLEKYKKWKHENEEEIKKLEKKKEEIKKEIRRRKGNRMTIEIYIKEAEEENNNIV